MNSTTRTYPGASDVVAQWQQAIRGNTQARGELLKRIMPGRRGR